MSSDDDAALPEGERRSQPKVRTHLSNERTFLAWLRTGLTSIALGLASAQVLDDRVFFGVSLTRTLAALLVGLGIGLVVLGRWRFRAAAIGIINGSFSPRRREFDAVVLTTIIIGVVALLVLVVD
jgi:putative membrane protein